MAVGFSRAPKEHPNRVPRNTLDKAIASAEGPFERPPEGVPGSLDAYEIRSTSEPTQARGRPRTVRARRRRHRDASPVGASFLFCDLFLLVVDLASVGLVLVW